MLFPLRARPAPRNFKGKAPPRKIVPTTLLDDARYSLLPSAGLKTVLLIDDAQGTTVHVVLTSATA